MISARFEQKELKYFRITMYKVRNKRTTIDRCIAKVECAGFEQLPHRQMNCCLFCRKKKAVTKIDEQSKLLSTPEDIAQREILNQRADERAAKFAKALADQLDKDKCDNVK